MSKPASIIIGTYNDLDILEASLASFAVQSVRNFEIVIADDGSSQDYAPILAAWSPRFTHGIQHVTQNKQGFRKARILNRAVHVSRFEHLVFVDMDCLPRADFVANHLSYLHPGTVIAGRRAHLFRDVIPTSAAILESGLPFGPLSLLRLWLVGKARVIEHGISVPLFYESSNTSLQGSNFSACKADLEAINGFNEEFVGWGKEDMELGLRLQLSGVRVRNLRNRVIQYHMLHEQLPFDNPISDKIYESTKTLRTIRPRRGLSEIQPGDFSLSRYRNPT